MHEEEKAEGFREPTSSLEDGGEWQLTSWYAQGHTAVFQLGPAPQASVAEWRKEDLHHCRPASTWDKGRTVTSEQYLGEDTDKQGV